MNFDQLLSREHATLHDSTLESIDVDYLKRTVGLGFNVSIGNPDAEDKAERTRRQRGQFLISGLLFLVLESPDPNRPHLASGGLTITDDGEVTTQVPKRRPALPVDLPSGSFVHYFFVNEWNSFIYLAATKAEFQWS